MSNRARFAETAVAETLQALEELGIVEPAEDPRRATARAEIDAWDRLPPARMPTAEEVTVHAVVGGSVVPLTVRVETRGPHEEERT